jgi:hypothetical protein
LTSKRSSSGCRNPPRGRSVGAWRTVREEADSPSVFRVLREFLCVFCLIHFVSGFLLHEVCRRSVLECRMVCDVADGPRSHRGWSVIEGAVLEVRGHFSDSPPQLADGPSCPRGWSARRSRTVHLVTCRTAKSFAS